MTANYTTISIAMDGIWAGSGKLVDGIIEDCGAQFCPDNDESLKVYELIEEAIEEGLDSIPVALANDTTVVISWSMSGASL